MDPAELAAKATIAAALITSHAVEIPAVPKNTIGASDPAAVRLRVLTDYVYEAITSTVES
jgi:hypothetical protein